MATIQAQAPFVDRTMMKNEGTSITKLASKNKKHPVQEDSPTSIGPPTKKFLTARSGLAGTANLAASIEAAKRREDLKTTAAGSPPKAGATQPRPNKTITELRRYYTRSDLPIIIQHGTRTKLEWKVDVTKLDFGHYLPIFLTGLRETDDPYRFVAEDGTYDMLRAGGAQKVLPVLPQLIVPIKTALETRDPVIMIRTLRVIQAIVRLGEEVGRALVPYYRQLLPVMAIFVNSRDNIGDKIDYHQRIGHVGDLVQETLSLLEVNGGPDAFINIKYLIPTYESHGRA